MQPVERSRLPSAYRQLLLVAPLVFVVLVLKSPDALVNPQFWAEDGVIFFTEQFGHHWPQLFTSYAGYWNFIPRLVAWIATAFPYGDAPLVYNLLTICMDSAAICYFAWRTRLFAPIWLTVSIFALVPTNGEIFGTLTNVQWFTQFALFALAIYPVTIKSASSNWAIRSITLLLALTGPFSIFIATLILIAFAAARVPPHLRGSWAITLRAWLSGLDRGVLAVMMLGAALQLTVLAVSGRGSRQPMHVRLAWDALAAGFQVHTFGGVLVKSWIFVCLAAAIGFALFNAARRHPDPVWPVIVATGIFGVVQIIFAALIVPNAHLLSTSLYGDRYFVFAKTVFWIWLAWGLRRLSSESSAFLMVPLLLLFIALAHPNYLQRKPLVDLHWKEAVEPLEHPTSANPVVIPINPIPWRIVVTPHYGAHQ